MRSVIETLELYYQPLTQQKKHWDFFLALSDYVGFIVDEPDLLGILTEEYKKDLAEQAKIAEYEKQSLEELEPKRNKLLAIVEKSGANSEGLKYAVSSIKNTPRLPQNAGYLEGSLFEIARHLAEEKGTEIVKEFIVSNDEYRKYTGAHSNMYGNFVFSKIFSSKIDYQRRYETRRKIEIWQSIEALFTAHKAITVVDQMTRNFEEEYAKRAKTDLTYKFVKDHTVLFAYGDVRKLRDYTGFQPEIDGMNYLELEEFRTYTRRVHLFLINQYRKIPEKNQAEIRGVKLTVNQSMPASFRPKLLIKNNIGHLQIFKQTKKHKIGGIETKHFRLVKCLFSPENSLRANFNPIYQGYERVFDAICSPKDKKDNRINNPLTAKTAMIDKIKITIKEVQGIKSLQGYIKFEWSGDNLRMNINPPEGNYIAT